MRRDDYIDFHAVEPEHRGIHDRLVNWGRWLHPSESPAVAPGFDLYRSPARAREHGAEHTWATSAVDGGDAARVNGTVGTLPIRHRAALMWCYCKPVNPKRAAQDIGVTLEGLADLLRESRQKLIWQGA
jgi:DNA-directed RNA polymerase specialized sigma24 family protein